MPSSTKTPNRISMRRINPSFYCARRFLRYTVGSVQRSIASIICALFTWALMLPLLLPSAGAATPECCRRTGKHHCIMAGERSTDPGTSINTIKARCPYCPTMGSSTQAHAGSPGTSSAIFAGLVRHPAVSPQVEATYRISHDRARQKRGPPFSSLLA